MWSGGQHSTDQLFVIRISFPNPEESPARLFVRDALAMPRRGAPEWPLGGQGARGTHVRVPPVDETAMQAKLRELRVAMAKERTARTEVHSVMEANGGRIWSSSKPATLRSRDGGLKLRELTAEELERIQRATDRAAASERAAAIAAVTAGRARSRSGRRVLDPLDISAFSASIASRSRPGSASSSRPQTPRVEHVVVRATSSVYAPPPRRVTDQGHGTEVAPTRAGTGNDSRLRRAVPRPPAAPSGSRPALGRRPTSARALNVSSTSAASSWQGEWHPDANDMIEPMGDPDPASAPRAREFQTERAEVLTFNPPFSPRRSPRGNATTTTVGGVRIANETPSLLDGSFDEEANGKAFAEALREWRGENEREINPKVPSSESTGPSLLDGRFDEAANRRAFAEALGEWRGDSSKIDEGRQKTDSSVVSRRSETPAAMETQTESPGAGGVSRPTTAKGVALKSGASYFERLCAGNVERLAAKAAVDTMTSQREKKLLKKNGSRDVQESRR